MNPLPIPPKMVSYADYGDFTVMLWMIGGYATHLLTHGRCEETENMLFSQLERVAKLGDGCGHYPVRDVSKERRLYFESGDDYRKKYLIGQVLLSSHSVNALIGFLFGFERGDVERMISNEIASDDPKGWVSSETLKGSH